MSDYRQKQCETMLEALKRAGFSGMTRKQFAELLGLKKSKHLLGLIDELINRGLAKVELTTDERNRPIFIYIRSDMQYPS